MNDTGDSTKEYTCDSLRGSLKNIVQWPLESWMFVNRQKIS